MVDQSTDWFQAVKKLTFEALPLENCSTCPFSFSRSSNANSSPKDVLLTLQVFNKIKNSFTFVRSFRSFSKATLIVYTDDACQNSFTPEMQNAFKNCGTIWINMKTVEKRYSWNLAAARMFLYFEFIHLHWQSLDRIAFCDAADAFFQDDVLTTDVKSSDIVFQSECCTYSSSHVNRAWYKTLYNSINIGFLGNKNVLNGGFVIGGAETVYRFFLIYIRMLLPIFDEPHYGVDQTLMNFIGYYEAFAKFGINITILPSPNDRYQSLTLCMGYTTENPDGIKINGKRIAYVHQYDRACKWIRALRSMCPPAGDWHISPYSDEARYSTSEKKCD